MTVEIPVGKGFVALIDDEDHPLIGAHKWQFVRGYAQTHVRTNGVERNVYMHRMILGLRDPKAQVDHANGNKLDNRRSNIRVANGSQNMANRKIQSNSSKAYKGVSLDKGEHRWAARIQLNGKRIRIGYFDTQEAAARAYNAKAIELFGEFARLNMMPDEWSI